MYRVYCVYIAYIYIGKMESPFVLYDNAYINTKDGMLAYNGTSRYAFIDNSGYFVSYEVNSIGDLHGDYSVFMENGQKIVQYNYKDGFLDGLQQVWYPNGNREAIYYAVAGNLHGYKRLFYENGQKNEEVMYINGFREGLFCKWHVSPVTGNGKNGHAHMPKQQLFIRCSYHKDKICGRFNIWDMNGNMLNDEMIFE